MSELEEIEKSLQEITQGEWNKYLTEGYLRWYVVKNENNFLVADALTEHNATLIASAPRWLRWCVEEIGRLHGLIEVMDESFNELQIQDGAKVGEIYTLRKEVEKWRLTAQSYLDFDAPTAKELLEENESLRKEVERLEQNLIDCAKAGIMQDK